MTITLLLHNIRSTHNVGSLLRSADGFGVSRIICSGYTPYPEIPNDNRLPHIRRKLTAAIHKTALGAEESIEISYSSDAKTAVKEFKDRNYQIVGLEQAKNSVNLADFTTKHDVLLLLGEEVEGLARELMELCDVLLEIPMSGQKESFNVSVAGALALYQFSC